MSYGPVSKQSKHYSLFYEKPSFHRVGAIVLLLITHSKMLPHIHAVTLR